MTQGPDPKLTKRQMRDIADALARGVTKTSLARAYGVSPRTIGRVVTRPEKKGYPFKPCGTVAAYRRHKKNKELACMPCLDANNRKHKTDRAKKESNEDYLQ